MSTLGMEPGTHASGACPQCGASLAERARFCPKCGLPANALTAASMPGSPSPSAAASVAPSELEGTVPYISSVPSPSAPMPAADISPVVAAMVSARVDEMQLRLLDRIHTIDRQVADLQVANAMRKKRWWQDLSVLIAVMAFLFSMGTTFFSYYQARQQEEHNARIELRSILQRLSAVQREYSTFRLQYPAPDLAQSNALASLSSTLQGENALLAKQALEISNIIPDQITASEYLEIAVAFQNSGLFDEAVTMLDKAERVIKDANDGSSIYRTRGMMLFAQNKLEEARAYMDKALNIFDKYPTDIPFYKYSTNALTELYWSGLEISERQCDEGRIHLDRGAALLDTLLREYPTLAEADNVKQLQLWLQVGRENLRKCTPN